ncbi:hypothetical protein niasHS_014537 [Heterodera schachtii]|uniref:SAGA-associated factor 11 n=1 Tax=Heterodera schachtii TaxID=97005 RepID=A0ABD2ILM7_HETSC
MEKRKSRAELLENEDALINAEVIDHLTESILENVFVGLMFEMHRNIAINKLVGLKEELVTSEQTKNETDRERKAATDESPPCATAANGGRTTQRGGKRTNGGRSRGAAECKCKCFVCHQMIAAVRFAPHLEKCIGIGRAARSRRRGVSTNFMSAASDAFADLSGSPSRSTRSSTLRSAARRLLSDGNDAASIAMAPTFLSRRRPLLVAEDFTLPTTASSAVTATTKALETALCTVSGAVLQQSVTAIKEEEEDDTEEPLRDRLRNKTNRGTNLLKK